MRTGEEYRASVRDGREVHINGERVADMTTRPDPVTRWLADKDSARRAAE